MPTPKGPRAQAAHRRRTRGRRTIVLSSILVVVVIAGAFFLYFSATRVEWVPNSNGNYTTPASITCVGGSLQHRDQWINQKTYSGTTIDLWSCGDEAAISVTTDNNNFGAYQTNYGQGCVKITQDTPKVNVCIRNWKITSIQSS